MEWSDELFSVYLFTCYLQSSVFCIHDAKTMTIEEDHLNDKNAHHNADFFGKKKIILLELDSIKIILLLRNLEISLMIYLPPWKMKIWALQDGTAVVTGGKTNRAKAEFEEEINRLLDQVPEIVVSSSPDQKEPDAVGG